jgi:chemotaxis protein CheX
MATTLSLKDVLLDGAKEVFETMVFMTLEEVEGQRPDPAGVTLLGTITFAGSLEGCLGVCCDMDGAKSIAAGMLCMDSPDELSDEDLVDAMGEIANMVMGAVKTRIQNDVTNLMISIPAVVQGRELRSRANEGMVQIVTATRVGEEHPVEFSLVYREGGTA